MIKELIVIDVSPMNIPKNETNHGDYVIHKIKNFISDYSKDFSKRKSSIENDLRKFIKVIFFILNYLILFKR